MGLQDNMAELPLEGVGGRLRNAREASGKSRNQYAEITKIPERMLAALEEGNYAALPARTYATGFARSYARALGLDAEAVVRQVRSELDGMPAFVERPTATSFEPGDPARVPGRRLAWIAAGLAVLVLIAIAFWRSVSQPAGNLPSILPSPTAAPAVRASAPPAAAAPSGPVTITAQSADVWLRISDGGKDLIQKNLAQGESFTIPADAADPRLRTGRPDALAITVGGHPVPPIADRQMLVSDVPMTAAALLARPSAASPATPPAGTSPAPAASASPVVHAAPRPRPAATHPDAVPAPAPEVTPAAVAPTANPSTTTQ